MPFSRTYNALLAEMLLSRRPDALQELAPHWIGYVVRRKLGLRTGRGREGYFIAASENARLASLCEKYGIATDEPADVNSVNSVNSAGDGQAEEMV